MKIVAEKDIKFLLKDPNADRPTSVRLFFRFNNQRLVYATGITIDPKYWNSISQRANTSQKIKRDRQPYEEVNNRLTDHMQALKRVWYRYELANTIPSVDNLRTQLDLELGKALPIAQKEKESFTAFIARFVHECKAGKRLTAKNTKYAEATIKDYNKLFNHLIAYQVVIRKPVDYNIITLEFYTKYKNYLTQKGYTLNTIGALLKNIKILLKQAYREGLHENKVFEHPEFRKFQEDTDSVYLNDEELNRLYALDLTKDQRLERVRDVFLIGCYSGLRWSDFSQLKPSNIKKDDKGTFLSVDTRKTGKRVAVPLNPNALAILAKYGNILPEPISNQKFNKYLKELAKLAELNTVESIGQTIGGKRTVKLYEKWELVRTHTARRSFATNAYLAGIPPVSIMMVTGHKTETQFLKYIKVTGEENAIMLLSHPHFSKK